MKGAKMFNKREDCVCCSKLTDNKNIFGFICKKCDEIRAKIFKRLINERK